MVVAPGGNRVGSVSGLEYLTIMFNIAAMSRRTRPHRERQPSPRQLDLIFRALGDQTRRKLLARLAQSPAIVTELAEPFALSLPAVSRHIRVLERARLIRRTVDGRIHQCELSPGALRGADAWLAQYRHFWETNLDAFARYVES
jgi:DNA-binding transcriptional ArsR family regulator